MTKLDLRRDLKHLYNPSHKAVAEFLVPAMNFIMLDGLGDPNTSMHYRHAIEALYGLAYTLKFTSKRTAGIDYTVMPLEGLWWMENMGTSYGEFDFTADKDRWLWKMMIMQPDHITREMVDASVSELGRKKNPPALERVRFQRFDEGLSAQIMHIGPYSSEKPTIDRIHAYIKEHGCKPAGKHHEIYLGDPRRTQPDRLKTVIRQPMRRTP